MWVQEEPENMGAFLFCKPRLEAILKQPLKFKGRKPHAAPATGLSKVYKMEQGDILAI